MLLSVEERPAGAVELSFGYGDFDRARGSLEVSYRNLWRSAEYASIRVEESNILKRGSFNYRQPRVFGHRTEGRFGLEWSDSKRLNQESREIYYHTRKTTTSYGLEKTYDRLKASLTYQFENVENYNIACTDSKLLRRTRTVFRVSSLTPALLWDLRDDIFNPRKGSLHGIALKEALTAIGSQADFTKLTVQSSWYIPVSTGVIGACPGAAAWHGRIETPGISLFMSGSTRAAAPRSGDTRRIMWGRTPERSKIRSPLAEQEWPCSMRNCA